MTEDGILKTIIRRYTRAQSILNRRTSLDRQGVEAVVFVFAQQLRRECNGEQQLVARHAKRRFAKDETGDAALASVLGAGVWPDDTALLESSFAGLVADLAY